MNCIINDKNKLPLDYKTAMNKDEILKRVDAYDGEVAYATDTNETYLYKDGKWNSMSNKVKIESEGLKMNLYDLNCSIVDQLPALLEFDNAIETIDKCRTMTSNEYYMLYGKDISYFTVFHVQPDGEFNSLGEAVIECLQSVGTIKAVDLINDDTTVEIWIEVDDTTMCMYLFPYDAGVVTVKEA